MQKICDCDPSFTGPRCEEEKDRCFPDGEPRCRNNGTCGILNGRPNCDCSGTGFTGKSALMMVTMEIHSTPTEADHEGHKEDKRCEGIGIASFI